MKRKVLTLLPWTFAVMLFGMGLGGCHTAEGFGGLMTGVGKDIEVAARGARHELIIEE